METQVEESARLTVGGETERPELYPSVLDERPAVDPLDVLQEQYARVDSEEARIILNLVRTLRHFKIRASNAETALNYANLSKQAGRTGQRLFEARKANREMRNELRRMKGRKVAG